MRVSVQPSRERTVNRVGQAEVVRPARDAGVPHNLVVEAAASGSRELGGGRPYALAVQVIG